MHVLDKVDLALAAAVLKTHAEMHDNRILQLAETMLPAECKEQIEHLEEDREVLSELADKMIAMIATAPNEGE